MSLCNCPSWSFIPLCVCVHVHARMHTVCGLASSSSQRFIFYGNLVSPELLNYFYIVAIYLFHLEIYGVSMVLEL